MPEKLNLIFKELRQCIHELHLVFNSLHRVLKDVIVILEQKKEANHHHM